MREHFEVASELLDIAKLRTIVRIAQDIEPYIPYKTGKLYKSQKIDVTDHNIKYNCEYTKYAFNPYTSTGKEKVYNRSVHKKAQGMPLEAAYAENKTRWAGYLEEELSKISDDLISVR